MIDVDISANTFKELSEGDIFLYNNKIYLVIPYIQASNYTSEQFNCLQLPNCSLNYIDDKTIVIPLEGHLQCCLKPGSVISI